MLRSSSILERLSSFKMFLKSRGSSMAVPVVLDPRSPYLATVRTLPPSTSQVVRQNALAFALLALLR